MAKRVQDPNCQEIQIAKISKLPKVLDVKNPKAPPRDPKVQELEKSTLLEAELFLVIAFPCIVKDPPLELMNPTL